MSQNKKIYGEIQTNENIAQSVLDTFKSAKVVFIEFKERKYYGRLVEYQLGKKMTYSVPKVDDYLSTKVSEGDPVVMRLITHEGKIVAFESELIMKRLPRLILKFPVREDDRFVRSGSRVETEIRTKIIVNENEASSILSDISTIGTISDLSEKGCSLTTNVKLALNDIVNLVVTLYEKGLKKIFQLRGTIQRIKAIDEGKFNYGIECSEKGWVILKEIKKIIESQNSKIV